MWKKIIDHSAVGLWDSFSPFRDYSTLITRLKVDGQASPALSVGLFVYLLHTFSQEPLSSGGSFRQQEAGACQARCLPCDSLMMLRVPWRWGRKDSCLAAVSCSRSRTHWETCLGDESKPRDGPHMDAAKDRSPVPWQSLYLRPEGSLGWPTPAFLQPQGVGPPARSISIFCGPSLNQDKWNSRRLAF